MIDTAKLDAIEKAAKEATPGEWVVTYNGDCLLSIASPHAAKCIALPKTEILVDGQFVHEPVTGYSKDADNFHYIATMNPTVALALVRELRALRELAFIVDSCMTFHQIKYPASEGIGNALAKVKAARVEK